MHYTHIAGIKKNGVTETTFPSDTFCNESLRREYSLLKELGATPSCIELSRRRQARGD